MELRYRRVIDWDVPNLNAQFVTNKGFASVCIELYSNDGNCTTNPLISCLSGLVNPVIQGDASRRGPADQGLMVQANFGNLPAGRQRSFTMYYGAAANRNEADQLLDDAGVEFASMAEPNVIDGGPNVFFYAIDCDSGLPPAYAAQSGECGSAGDLVGTTCGAGDNAPAGAGASGVRYADGVVSVLGADLFSTGFGVPWGQVRSWSNAAGYVGSGTGMGMAVSQLPHLVRSGVNPNTVAVVSNATTARYFDFISGSFVPRHASQERLSYDAVEREYVLTDTLGNQLRFHDFGAGTLAGQRGQPKSFHDPSGNATTLTYENGVLMRMERTTVIGSPTVTEQYLYHYLAHSPSESNTGRLREVVLQRNLGGTGFQTVRKVTYSYYDGAVPMTGTLKGVAGDLMRAEITDEMDRVIDTHYYRSYAPGEPNGYLHGLKYAFRPPSYDRAWAAAAAQSQNVLTADDALVAPYADRYLKYDSSRRVSEQVVQGAGCSSCMGGLGTYRYAYELRGGSDRDTDYNHWRMKTVETLPDGNQNLVFTNFAGQVMLHVFHETGSGRMWRTFTEYDGHGASARAGRATLRALPSAVTGHDEYLYADLLNYNAGTGRYQYLDDGAGLIEVLSCHTTTTAMPNNPGPVAGYLHQVHLRRGETGPLVTQRTTEYEASPGAAPVYPVGRQTVYRTEATGGAQVTRLSYGWYAGTRQMASREVRWPAVRHLENGYDGSDVETTTYDRYGRVTRHTDGDGFAGSYGYDPATSGVTQVVVHAGGTVGDLTTNLQVDKLGRTTKVTEPNNTVTYTVYKDVEHEVRTYPGWQGAPVNRLTGPTQVSREHRPRFVGDSLLCDETLTMSAQPTAVSDGMGGTKPDGGEGISEVQTLSRRHTSAAGQTTDSDRYFNLSGVTYSTLLNLAEAAAAVNYYRTDYGYDERGRLSRVLTPSYQWLNLTDPTMAPETVPGTIYRTVFDGLGRMISSWVGTSDTPDWSPGNPGDLVQTHAYEYDHNQPLQIGDSNLTRMTEFPGGGAASRVTEHSYDWRNRRVASKAGVQAMPEDANTQRPLVYAEYDNLSQVIATEQYDGDGLFIIDPNLDGVPDKPWKDTNGDGTPDVAAPDRLRARSTAAYDDRGRVYRSETFNVDQVDPGAGDLLPGSLKTHYWYDKRSNLIKTVAPGGLVTKAQYDGAGRLAKTFVSDGGGDIAAGLPMTWDHADDVLSDTVLTQAETQRAAGMTPPTG